MKKTASKLREKLISTIPQSIILENHGEKKQEQFDKKSFK